jgi:hypothetical protein
MNPNDANPNLQCHTSSDVKFLHKSLGSSFTNITKTNHTLHPMRSSFGLGKAAAKTVKPFQNQSSFVSFVVDVSF